MVWVPPVGLVVDGRASVRGLGAVRCLAWTCEGIRQSEQSQEFGMLWTFQILQKSAIQLYTGD